LRPIASESLGPPAFFEIKFRIKARIA